MSDETSSEINTESDAPSADTPDDAIESEAAERLAMRFSFDEEQTQLFLLLTNAAALFAQNGKPAFGDATEQKQLLALFTRALNDPEIALAAWDAWSEEGLTGDALQPFIDEIVGSLEGSQPGVIWLMSRQAALQLDNDESTRLLELVRDSGHASVLIDLAALQADGSNPIEARDLLRAAGVDTEIDLDAAYDPITSDLGLGVELAEEIAPFAAQRPKPIAGRNDVCPCGSSKKYKHCHLGKELHSLNDRAAWLYLKMMRFMQITNRYLPDTVVAEMTSSLETPDLATMLESSYIPTDIALHEGGVASRFFKAKHAVLPADEVELTEQWIRASRSVFRVKKSTHAALELIDLRSRTSVTIVGTVPKQQLEVGTLICGRPLPVGQTHRSYGGFLPVDESMSDGVLEACDSRNLATVAISLSQIFDAAEMADAMAAE